ncbi:peptide N-acetyl-beta-D-glucosaminyl asparaginase amidase A-domain-containing protein [Infundibulicybe gibba]|nr:peptide N-acetyl-beta-D-glucosaminyl asparaginase amidase A-domain-containing protein [Infundibulicybe gibba]
MRLLFLFPVCLLFICLSRGAVLVDFQVASPPVVPLDAKQCTIQVLHPIPDVISPSPLEATINGTQFDRLGIFTFQNVEIWRTSTPEPTRGDGIIWTYVKDVTQYTPLFTRPGTFIFQLDNLIQPGLDGIYSNMIIPLSTLSNTTGNDASVPPAFTINTTLPQNIVEIYAELFASGNGQEESWYFNVPNNLLPNIPSGLTFGQGPFREVRLLVDGKLAGVAFPYPVIFTGGFVPSFWSLKPRRPITAYGALELPTYFIDLTPFVPLLVDGNPHTFQLDVVSAEGSHDILQNWFVSGLLQVITDPSEKATTGEITLYSAPAFAQSTTKGSSGGVGEIDFTVQATRSIHIESNIISGSGHRTHVVWKQNLQYDNHQTYKQNGTLQTLQQLASGSMSSTHNNVPMVSDIFSFPLDIDFQYLSTDLQNWTTTIDHSYVRSVLPNPFILGSTVTERQQTNGFFQLAPTGNTGNGTSNNTFNYLDRAGNTYNRRVNAALNQIILDEQTGNLAPVAKSPGINKFAPATGNINHFAGAHLPGGIRTQ